GAAPFTCSCRPPCFAPPPRAEETPVPVAFFQVPWYRIASLHYNPGCLRLTPVAVAVAEFARIPPGPAEFWRIPLHPAATREPAAISACALPTPGCKRQPTPPRAVTEGG